MQKAERLQPFLNLALCILAFSIPTKFIISSISLGLLSVLWLVQANYKQVWANLKKRKALWPWFIFYLLLLISYTYSENKEQAAFDLKAKISYFIIPIIVGAGIDFLNRKFLERFFIWFISGVVVAALVSYGDAFTTWKTDGTNHFFYHDLVTLLDPNAVYSAWYAIFAVSLLMFMPWKYHFVGKYNIVRLALITFLLIFFFMLSARMFMVLFLLFIIPYAIKKSFKGSRKRGILITSGISVLLVVGGIALYSTDNPIKARFSTLLHRDTEIAWLDDYSNSKLGFDNASLRLFLWRLGIESINEKKAWLTGVGNGDVHITLRQKMIDYKVPYVDNPLPEYRPKFHSANLHNMFLQALVMVGIGGTIIMIIIAFTPLFYLNKVLLYQPFLLFNITSIFFMMQEAVLQTQAGIIFYILISSIFWNLYYSNYQIKNKHL